MNLIQHIAKPLRHYTERGVYAASASLSQAALKRAKARAPKAARPAVACLMALLTLTGAAFGQVGQSLPFIGFGQDNAYNGYLQITANNTNTYGSTNLVYTRGSFTTNVLTAITNPANGLVITGYVSQVFPNYLTNASAFQDVNLWANRDGTPPVVNLSADINGTSAQFTNIVTFTFAAGPTPTGNVGTQPQNLWSFSMNGNGTSDVVLATNVPSSFLQGMRKLRLLSVGSSGAGNGQVVNVWLNGYRAAPAE